jgi:hypothetical protein
VGWGGVAMDKLIVTLAVIQIVVDVLNLWADLRKE